MTTRLAMSNKTLSSLALALGALPLLAGPGGAQAPSQLPAYLADQTEFGIGEHTMSSPLFIQFMGMGQSLHTVTRRRSERANDGSVWFTEKRDYSVSYWITGCGSRNGGDDFFVAGIKADGTTTVEHWRFNQPGYRYTVDYDAPAPAMGVPAGVFSPYVRTGNGGAWKWSNRKIRKVGGGGGSWVSPGLTPTKTVLYEGAEGPFTAVGADPEGRFLLLYDYGAKAIVQFELNQASPSFTPVYDLSGATDFVRIDNIWARDFNSAGDRTYLLGGVALDTAQAEVAGLGVMQDLNNDGLFESSSFSSRVAFLGTAHGVWSNWILFHKIP